MNQTRSRGVVTYFAPAERKARSELQALALRVAKDPLLHAILRTVQGHVLVVNRDRQILAASDEALQLLSSTSAEVVGARPGELLHCLRSSEGPSGCGTSMHCRTCGIVTAILASQESREPVQRECLVTSVHDGHIEAREYEVRAVPLSLAGAELTLCVLVDVTAQRRREALEEVFFHDITNTIGGLHGWAQLLRDGVADPTEAARHFATLSERLLAEVTDQRLLLRAERGELVTERTLVHPSELLTQLKVVFAGHPAADRRSLRFEPIEDDTSFPTDATLVARVLTNMAKNALEAVRPGREVVVRYAVRDGNPTFAVWNAGKIPERIALRVFERSFSSKQPRGRGLGTYSMKLFAEAYLGGEIGFTSTEKDGTAFTLTLPASGPVRLPR